jgi:hypothetical protein
MVRDQGVGGPVSPSLGRNLSKRERKLPRVRNLVVAV